VLFEEHERQHREELAALIDIRQSQLVRNSLDVVDWPAETFDAAAATVADREDITDVLWVTPAVAETPAETTEAEPVHALFDSADDMFVRHLLAGTDERPSFEHATDPPAGSAHAGIIDEAAPGREHQIDVHAPAASETEAEPIGVEPHALFDGKDDWFVRHLFEETGDPLPVDSTDPPAESAHVESEAQMAPSSDRPSPDVFDTEDDTFVHHLFPPKD
jgi:hypothetical protein